MTMTKSRLQIATTMMTSKNTAEIAIAIDATHQDLCLGIKTCTTNLLKQKRAKS